MSQYQGEMDMAMANIEIYRNNPAGIGEHPEVAHRHLTLKLRNMPQQKKSMKHVSIYLTIENKPH